jgi:hypothetical protein
MMDAIYTLHIYNAKKNVTSETSVRVIRKYLYNEYKFNFTTFVLVHCIRLCVVCVSKEKLMNFNSM